MDGAYYGYFSRNKTNFNLTIDTNQSIFQVYESASEFIAYGIGKINSTLIYE